MLCVYVCVCGDVGKRVADLVDFDVRVINIIALCYVYVRVCECVRGLCVVVVV